EPDLLEEVAAQCGGAPVFECDVSDRGAVEAAVDGAAEALGGLDVVMANAGIAAQLPIVGGDPAVFEKTQAVNVLGVYYTVRAAGRGIERRSRRVCAPAWVELLLPTRMVAQRAIDLAMGRNLGRALEIAREEDAPFTTEQPSSAPARA